MRYCLVLLLLLFPLTVEASSEENLPPGAVATVNGQAITLRQIEAFHDVSGGALVVAQSPSVELLQEQYGSSLFALIVQALMQQELERLGFSITDAEVSEAEALIRADYAAPEVFEKELQEEYIELSVWREMLRQRLASQRFQERVLRPMFTVSPEEVGAYYTEHKALFLYPEQIELLWIQNADKAVVESLRARWIREQSQKTPNTKVQDKKILDAAQDKGTDQKTDSDETAAINWDMERLRVAPERLPAQLRKDLSAVKPNQATPVRQEGDMHQFAVLCQKFPTRKLSVVEAFPLIERLLVEARLEPAYAAWIEKQLPRAVIRIAPGLNPGQPIPEATSDDDPELRRTKPTVRYQDEEESADEPLPEQSGMKR